MVPQLIEFHPEADREIFAAAPTAPAVFLLQGEEGTEPYISKTANLRRRLLRLLGPAEEHTRRLNLRHRVRRIEYALTGSDFESGLLLYRLLRKHFPEAYAARLRLRPPVLARLQLENTYPRMSLTTHLGSARGRDVYYGPFASRVAAEKFVNDALDFFKMRRCVDDLNPDPAFPGCIYSEMKMCLAPCFKGCSDEEYAAEVARVQTFFDTRGVSLMRELTSERDQASAGLEFETAAALHARLDKLQPVLSQLPEITRRLDQLFALMVQPSARPESVTLFLIEGGRISDPVVFNLQAHEAGKSQSMEARVQEALAAGPAPPRSSRRETLEHLSILKRWYFRTSKTGEIFFANEKGDLPWRRIVRGISRVFRGEKPAADLSESARDYWLNRARETEI